MKFPWQKLIVMMMMDNEYIQDSNLQKVKVLGDIPEIKQIKNELDKKEKERTLFDKKEIVIFCIVCIIFSTSLLTISVLYLVFHIKSNTIIAILAVLSAICLSSLTMEENEFTQNTTKGNLKSITKDNSKLLEEFGDIAKYRDSIYYGTIFNNTFFYIITDNNGYAKDVIPLTKNYTYKKIIPNDTDDEESILKQARIDLDKRIFYCPDPKKIGYKNDACKGCKFYSAPKSGYVHEDDICQEDCSRKYPDMFSR